MKLSAVFQNGMCQLELRTEDEFEEKLLGAVAKNSGGLGCVLEYEPGYMNSRGKVVKVLLDAREG